MKGSSKNYKIDFLVLELPSIGLGSINLFEKENRKSKANMWRVLMPDPARPAAAAPVIPVPVVAAAVFLP